MQCRIIVAVLALLVTFPALAKSLKVPLGDKNVTIEVISRGGGTTCVALHSNETTAVSAVAGLCGSTIIIKNGGARDIKFTLDGVSYRIDPNRIFTKAGRHNFLSPKGNAAALQAVARFADAIVSQFTGSLIVGLHNNKDGGYSINSYSSAKKFPDQDPDNFVLTTSRTLYNQAVAAGFNAVMESGGKDDGSLSVYAKQRGKSYLNVEAQAGNLRWQRDVYGKFLRD